MNLTPLQAAELRRCKNDFLYFQRTYLKLVDKDARLVAMRPNTAQRSVYADLLVHRWLLYLKSRQLGCSAEVAAFYFWIAMFHENVSVLVVAHHAESVRELFRKFYATYYRHLPGWLKEAFPLLGAKKGEPQKQEIQFFHGSRIVITTANSEKARSGTYNLIHLSEFSRYDSLLDTVAAIFGTATPGAQIVLETTADGPNEAYQMWTGQSEFAQAKHFQRRFFGWPIDERAIGARIGTTGNRYHVDLGVNERTGQRESFDTDFDKEPLTEWESEYQKDHDLSIERMAWARWCLAVKCLGSINTFNQEAPITADVAFVLGGKPYFTVKYIECAGGEDAEGIAKFAEPGKFRCYVMGVDTANGGPDGNWSALTILDISQEMVISDACTLGGRFPIMDFARMVHALAIQYDCLVNVESNMSGASVIEVLTELKYWKLTKRVQLNQVTNKLEDRLGYHTGAASRTKALMDMQDALARRAYVPSCDRIKRSINHFVYNDKGKPEAARGRRDDFVFSTAMAIVAIPQARRHREETAYGKRPTTVQEVLQWEMATGREYVGHGEIFGNDDDESMIDELLVRRRSVQDIMSGIGAVRR